MSDQVLMNDDAARSPTGEILDQATPTTPTPEPKADASADAPKPDVDAPKPDDAPKAPDAYADFKAPDGYSLDPKTIEAATPIFKELGLTQDQAQKLVDFHASQMLEAAKAPQSAYESLRGEWQSAVKADPEMSGKLDTVKSDIGRALNALGDAKLVSDFKSAMDLTGAGDHPAFVKAMWKLSQYVIEGKHVAGKGPSAEGQTDPSKGRPTTGAKALYPNNP